MKSKEQYHSKAMVLTALFLLLNLFFPIASASDEQNISFAVTESQITSNEFDQHSPEIYEDNIVWKDNRDENWKIYTYNLSTFLEYQMVNIISINNPLNIYKDRVVYQDNRDVGSNVFLYNLSTSTETQITMNQSWQASPAICEDIITWADYQSGNNGNIHMYNLSTHEEMQITSQSGQDRSAIYNNRIVWQDARNGNWDIYMCDLSTFSETQITDNISDQEFPAIYEDRIVWQDNRNGNSDIYMYNLSTFSETQITFNSLDQLYPSIYENKIVWQDARNGNWDIYMYDLSDSKEIQLTTDKTDQEYPGIYDNRIVWQDERNGNYDIYMATISEIGPEPKSPVANFSSNLFAGYIPLTVQFIDLSEGMPTEWYWDFGDGEYSGLQNPIHTYYEPGNYTVTLEVSNPEGNASLTKTAYVQVKPASSVKLTSITLDPENSTGATTNAPGIWTTNLADPLAQMAVKNDNGILLNQANSETSLGEISIPLAPGINNFTLIGDNIFLENENYGAVLFFDGVQTPPQIAVYNCNDGTGNFSVQHEGTSIIGSANGGLFFDTAPGTYIYTAPDGTKVEVSSFIINSNGSVDEVSWGNIDANGIPDTVAKLSLKVTLPSGLPVADFSTIPDSGNAPLKVRFTDISTGKPFSWSWDFGDGNNDPVNPNPEHIYTAPGTYNASLTVTNENGTDSKSATITVLEEKPLPVLPAININSNITSGYAPLSVKINGFLENVTEINWNFGDRDNSFANLNLEHLFPIPGTYNISVNAGNENGTNSKVVTINVLKPPVLPVADFESNITSGSSPLTVQFIDLLENTTERSWDFGDGTNSTEQNPVHTYDKAGKYTVSLTARNIVGINTVTKYNYIRIANEISAPLAAFSATPVSGNVPFNVSFTDQSTGSPISWKWNFGDGTNSTEQNPVHAYTKEGQYTVTLAINNAAGSNALAKYSYINAINPEKVPVTAFSASPTSGKVPLSVNFIDNSTNIPDSWKWNFGDGNSSTEQNPVYVYSKTGKFNVTLTAKNAAGSNTVTKSGLITVSKAA